MEPVKGIKAQGFVPELSLLSDEGQQWNIRDRLRRKNVVVYFAHDISCADCRERLKALAELELQWRRTLAEVVVVFPNTVEELKEVSDEFNLPYPLLSDEDGRAAEAFSFETLGDLELPYIFAVDRYATLFFKDVDDRGDAREEVADVWSEIDFLESQCPECGVAREDS